MAQREGRRVGGGEGRGDGGRTHRVWWVLVRTLDFSLHEVGAMEGSEWRRDMPDWGFHRIHLAARGEWTVEARAEERKAEGK